MRVLLINRHNLGWATGESGAYLPVPPEDRFLITRTFGHGLAGYDSAGFPNVAVIDTYYPERTEAVANWLIETRGIDRVVALHEKDMILAARLRAAHGLAGLGPDVTLRFRDKVLMKDTLVAAGYRDVPGFRAVRPDESLEALPWPGPVVVKNRGGVGASEVVIAHSLAAANQAVRQLAAGPLGVEVEEYIDGGMVHCDAVVAGGRVVFAAVSQYIAQPGRFAPGGVAGSVLLTSGDLRERIVSETSRVLGLLGLDDGVTHVEFFHTPGGGLVFCEAAARPGGGGISDIVERAYGVDLVRCAVELQCGHPPRLELKPPPHPVVGVVGVYHRTTSGNMPVTDLPLTVPDVVSYAFDRPEVSGKVRHCTDYAHKVIIATATRAAFDESAAAAVAAIRAGDAEPAECEVAHAP